MTTCLEGKTSAVSRRQPNPRILCIDDDPDFQTAIELRLRDYDVAVEHAYYGMQGIVEAPESNPDVILMFQAIPHVNGEYALATIKRNPATARIPVIVLTGMRNPALRNRLLQAGAEAFLQKPVLFDELLHEIGRLIDLRKRTSEEN